jgi:hypothetical protein
VRLKELIIHLDKMLFDKFKDINNVLNANHNSKYPKMKDIEHWKNNLSQYGFNYNGLNSLKELISKRVTYLTEKQNNTFTRLIFKDTPSERFFTYIVEKWLKEEVNKVTAIRFVFTEMWVKNTEKLTPYKITATQPYFAREYWNLKYSNIYKFENTKNPKLNKDTFTDYYHKRFKNLLDEFQGG